MALLMTSGPTLEPVTLAEAKAHLRVDSASEDVLIASLITTARLQIETALSIALLSQTWSYFIDKLPRDGLIPLPLRPVRSLDAVRRHQDDGGFADLPASGFTLDGLSIPPRIVARETTAFASTQRPVNAYELSVTVGFGVTAADVPAPIREAVLQLVAHWFEHRDPSEIGTEAARIPAAVSQLLAPWQSPRLV